MNKSLVKKIDRVKNELCKLKDAPKIGKLNDGIKQEVSIKGATELVEFLKFCNGARFGEIDLWGYTELKENQYRLELFEVSRINWIEFGQILYEPLFLKREDNHVFLYSTYGEKPKMLGFFDEFLDYYAFGEGYRFVVPDAGTSRWFLFLKSIGLIK